MSNTDFLSESALRRIQSILDYQASYRLSHQTLCQSGNPRYDLMQHILLKYFSGGDEESFFPSHLLDTLKRAQSNDEREHVYLKCFSMLGICGQSDLSLIQGQCDAEKNYRLLNQLLDLVEAKKDLNFGQAQLIKDINFTKQIVQNGDRIFTKEYKLFNNDMLSRISEHKVPSQGEFKERINVSEKNLETLKQQVDELRQQHSLIDSDVNLDSAHTESIDDPVEQIISKLNTLGVLMQRFVTTFNQEFTPWVNQVQKTQNTSQSFDANTNILGPTSTQVLITFKKIDSVLVNLQTIQQMIAGITHGPVSQHIKRLLEDQQDLISDSALYELSSELDVLENSIMRLSGK
ncbi:hypothetical protein AKO1_014170 [Acrasis kona]|uniref:Uncharacterized protein n=1 Tax=Acrasis kona TaxID=1008807 RepID=A0AAW2YZE4_9EUKA